MINNNIVSKKTNSISTNALLNLVQNVAKILFPLITIPYASRVLGPSNYGKVSFGNSIVRYLVLLAALGVSTYSQREGAPLRDDKEKIGSFANQVFTINVFSTVVSYLVLMGLLFFSYKIKDYSDLLLIQSSAIVLGTIGADWVNVVYEDYLYLTIRYIIMQFLSLLMMFLFVKTPSNYLLYAAFSVLASAGGNLFNIIYIRRYVKLKLVNLKTCSVHIKPILLLFSVSITTVIYVSSDITIIGLYMKDSDVGIYTMATNIYSVVKQIISALLVVSVPRLAYYWGNSHFGEFKDLAQKVLNSLIIFLFPTIIGMIVLRKHLLIVLGGNQYISGQFVLIVLSTALLFAVLAGFYSNGCLLIMKKDKLYLLGTSLSAVLNIITNIILIPRVGIIGAAITTLLAEICMMIVSSTYVIPRFDIRISRITIISVLVGSIVVGVICFCLSLVIYDALLTIILSFISSVLVYYLVLYLFRNPIVDSINKLIMRFFPSKPEI